MSLQDRIISLASLRAQPQINPRIELSGTTRNEPIS